VRDASVIQEKRPTTEIWWSDSRLGALSQAAVVNGNLFGWRLDAIALGLLSWTVELFLLRLRSVL
jgi:hypothetical protein